MENAEVAATEAPAEVAAQVDTQVEVAVDAPAQEAVAAQEAEVAPERKSLLDQAKADEVVADEAGADVKEEEATAEAVEYDAFTLPEGMEADTVALAEFTPLAKELGLSQEGAQKLVDVMANKMQAEAKAAKEAQDKQIDAWEQDIKTNPDWKQDVLLADKAIQAIGNEEFTALMNDPTIGSYPPVKAALAQVGKWLSESNFVEGNGSEVVQSRTADKWYPGNTGK